jgi:hypothetical protein
MKKYKVKIEHAETGKQENVVVEGEDKREVANKLDRMSRGGDAEIIKVTEKKWWKK